MIANSPSSPLVYSPFRCCTYPSTAQRSSEHLRQASDHATACGRKMGTASDGKGFYSLHDYWQLLIISNKLLLINYQKLRLSITISFAPLNLNNFTIPQVELLVRCGANVAAVTRDGLSSLHCAARSGHEHVVRYLLHDCADAPGGAPGTQCSLKTKNGLTVSLAVFLYYKL